MTKRYYPFEEYQSGRQMKVHVGAKQVDLGVANECRMPMVYGKTFALLFGRNFDQVHDSSLSSSHVTVVSKPNLETSVGENNNVASSRIGHLVQNQSPSKSHRLYKQMHIDSFGQLSKHGKDITSAAATPKTSSGESCSSCNSSNGIIVQSRCEFCERLLCDKCLSTCDGCHSLFCPLCSVKVYGSKEEVSVCLSCLYGRM